MKCGASRVLFIRGQLQLPPTPHGAALGLHKAETLAPNPQGASLRSLQPNPRSEKLLERNEVMGDAQVSPTLSPEKAGREGG